eukprot:Skav232961  [mRNA]  locus=scaffold1735:105934:108039:- [translate_table: standard]
MCLAGSYCPGGQLADSQCPPGSTSPFGSVSIEDCHCRRGYFWDVQVSACSMCPAGFFKNYTGSSPCQSCPQETTSTAGAIWLHECYCPAGTIDVDSSSDFDCADASTVGNGINNDSFARIEAWMFAFNGSLASLSGSLEMVHSDLIDYMGLRTRASLQLTDHGDQIVYKVATSEEEEAVTLHAKMDPAVFTAFTLMTATAALTSETVVTRQDIFSETIVCPDGLGFAAGSLVHSLSDCKCVHGTEPAGESGLGSGCTKCPRGKHKSLVADVSCSSCSGLTTLLEGAISSAFCTCSAGFVNEVLDDPTNCQPCGKGFYCEGGTHKAACGQSLSTATETATEAAECICAAGFFRSESTCEPCPRGRFKSDLGNVACHPCPAGTWSNESAATHEDACNSCMEGSTTLEDGAENAGLCVRPEPGQRVQCTSGAVCMVQIKGFQLHDGHHLALTQSSCDTGKVAVSGVVAQGISYPATNSGSEYVWGDSGSEFSPVGGLYNLCWCANMRHLGCESLENNFVLSAGQLEVIGPFSNHSFECVRGQNCSGLTAFRGRLLSAQNQVALRNACGGAVPMSVASTNPNGTGALSISSGDFSIGFGDIVLNADEGYAICWCGQFCNAKDFAVPAGHLRVLGPHASQEADCFLGQQCQLKSIRGVGLMLDDQIMLRSDCSTSPMLLGSPGNGVAYRNESRAEKQRALFRVLES